MRRMLADIEERGPVPLETVGHLSSAALAALVDQVWPAVLEAALPKACFSCSYVWDWCPTCPEANDCMRALAAKVNAGEMPGFLP